MRIQENKGATVNYYIQKYNGYIAKEIRYDYAEFLKAIEFMKMYETDVCFDNEEDIEFVCNEDDKVEVANKIYNIEDYSIQLGTNISLLVINIYLKEIY